jgi:hypothetical protein
VRVYCTKHAQLFAMVGKRTPAHTWVQFSTLSPSWKAHHAATSGIGERVNAFTNLSEWTQSEIEVRGCEMCGPRMLDVAVLLKAFEEGRDKISL